ncbi:MAG: hypothetical protein CENE_00991 [Candidatus Celerinatantimonas neptuna]|nr:MAG: hypothetical protein CENE_00991 [Candidatus Celerinatantimonas neptuna]
MVKGSCHCGHMALFIPELTETEPVVLVLSVLYQEIDSFS